MLEQPSNDVPAENYLLVGSDTREGVDPDSIPTPAASATPTRSSAAAATRSWSCAATSQRRRRRLLEPAPRPVGADRRHRRARRRSTPPTTRARATWSQTITAVDCGIPIHHYVEVDFAGFKSLVDAIGGVEVCVDVPDPGHQHRAERPRARLPDARRLAGAGLRPQPPLRGVRSTASGRRTARPTSAASKRQQRLRQPLDPGGAGEDQDRSVRQRRADRAAIGESINVDADLDPLQRRGQAARGRRRGHRHLQPPGGRQDDQGQRGADARRGRRRRPRLLPWRDGHPAATAPAGSRSEPSAILLPPCPRSWRATSSPACTPCRRRSTATSAACSSRRTAGSGSPNGREMIQGNRGQPPAGCARRAALPPASGRLLVRPVRHRRGSCCTTCARAARPTAPRWRSTCPATTTSACSSRPASPTASPRSPTWSSPTSSTATTTRPTSSAWRGTIPPSPPTGASPTRSCRRATRPTRPRRDLPAGRRPYWPMRT